MKIEYIRKDDVLNYFKQKLYDYDNKILTYTGTAYSYRKFAIEAMNRIENMESVRLGGKYKK